MAKKRSQDTASRRKQQRRRPPRWVWLIVVLAVGVGVAAYVGLQRQNHEQALKSGDPWFAPYADVTNTPIFAFEQLAATDNKNMVLSFIVSQEGSPCTPAWGSRYTLDQANNNFGFDQRVDSVRQQGGVVVVSFGGLTNDELAVKCTDSDQLKAAYSLVIDRYGLDVIDLDLEQTGLSDKAAGKRRARAIAQIQQEKRALAVWVTLPADPQGLTEEGVATIGQLLDVGVDIAGVNIMAMNYSQSRQDGQSMVEATKSALAQTHRQLGEAYERAGTRLDDSQVWSKLGVTPMIGQNDVPSDLFSLDDAKGLNKYARDRGLGRISMWSANRDAACDAGQADAKKASNSCSGVGQERGAFVAALGADFR